MSSVAKPVLEKDAASIAEARALVDRAWEAFQTFQHFSQEQVDAVVGAMAAAAAADSERLARMAVEETTYGVAADKTVKNLFAAQHVYEAIRPLKTVGVVREDRARGILEIAVPVGVVAAVLPSTNPTSTAIYKALIAVKGRNAIVLSPHPTAMRCTCETAAIMRQAAEQAGAPPGLIGCMGSASVSAAQELMRHKRTSVILATGGMGMVRAAYSSGKPAFGVGPGNVPAFIDRSADIAKAVADVVHGKTFDHGTICSSEQAIVAESAIRDAVRAELQRRGAYFLSKDEIASLGQQMVNLEAHTISPKFVGQSARRVAELAGLKVPAETRVLVAELEDVGRQWPLSAEKLSPVLALYFAVDRAAGFDLCAALLRFGGLGHTCAIHALDDGVIREYGLRMPASRVVVNSPAPLGSIGYTTNLFPAMTLGCGAVGGNITSDNISPLHLINLRRVAYEKKAVSSQRSAISSQLSAFSQHDVAQPPSTVSSCACGTQPGTAVPQIFDADANTRVAIARAIERFLSSRPQPRPSGGTPALQGEAHVPTAPPKPSPTPVPKLKPRAVDFVSVAEVRSALSRKEKIVVGKKTIITPAARDLAAEYDVLAHEE